MTHIPTLIEKVMFKIYQSEVDNQPSRPTAYDIYIMDHMHSKFKFHKFNLLKKLVIQHESKFDFREVREFKSSLPI